MGIILASQSPRRKEILTDLGFEFRVIVSDSDEYCEEKDPAKYVEILSERKARAVLNKVSEGDTVIAADTVVVCNGIILGKPKDRSDAENMLNMLSGNMHHVITGVCVCINGKFLISHDVTKVYFKSLSDRDISDYLDTNEFSDKAGSYAIQGIGGKFVEKIEGSYTNVIGLPKELTIKLLDEIKTCVYGQVR